MIWRRLRWRGSLRDHRVALEEVQRRLAEQLADQDRQLRQQHADAVARMAAAAARRPTPGPPAPMTAGTC